MAFAPSLQAQQAPAAPAPPAAAPPPKPPLKPFKAEPISGQIQRFLALPQTRGVAKVFSQQLAYMIPRGFQPYADGDDGNFYIVQLGPAGEDTSNWSQSIQVVGYRGLGGVPELTAQAMAQTLASPREDICKDNWLTTDLGPLTVDTYPAHAVMVGCASAPVAAEPGKSATANGQQAVILVVRALYDIYTVQISFRGLPYDKARPPADEALARQLLARLQPVAVCAISIEVQECVARQTAMMTK